MQEKDAQKSLGTQKNIICVIINDIQAQAKKKISQFYTDLSLDSRFTPLQNNVWDLKSNHKLSEVLFDSSALLDESDDEDAPIIEDYDDVDVNDDDRRVDLDSLD